MKKTFIFSAILLANSVSANLTPSMIHLIAHKKPDLTYEKYEKSSWDNHLNENGKLTEQERQKLLSKAEQYANEGRQLLQEAYSDAYSIMNPDARSAMMAIISDAIASSKLGYLSAYTTIGYCISEVFYYLYQNGSEISGCMQKLKLAEAKFMSAYNIHSLIEASDRY